MPIIEDKELGRLNIRRSSKATSMRASVAPNGSLRISVPSYAPMFMVKRMIANSRPHLKKLLERKPLLTLTDGMTIGKSHTLLVREGNIRSVKRSSTQLLVTLASNESLNDPDIVHEVREHMRSIIRKEAKHHLPRRLHYLAEKLGYSYTSLRFTHASSRWGSCNSKKAISLNIALMNLPFELIDYVLVHELAHTVQLNHSLVFWGEVERGDPDYRKHRRMIKAYDPAI